MKTRPQTHEEFMADIARFHEETQAMADEWAAWREKDRQRRAEKAKQPGIPELYQMLSEVLQQLAELKGAVAA